MKTKCLALFVATVTLLAGAVLTSCQKVEPTALNTENMQFKTAVKGIVRFNNGSKMEEIDKAPVIAKIYLKTKDEKGNDIEKFVTSVSTDTKNGGAYTLNLPIASGNSYKVVVSSTFEESEGKATATFYGSKTLDGVNAGDEKVAHLNCAAIGYPEDPEK